MACKEYERLINPKYLEFFSIRDGVYTFFDGVHQPHYIGVAYEFMCEISSSTLVVDYDDLYRNVFPGNVKWLYVDYLQELSDVFVGRLTAVQAVTVLAAIRQKEIFCTGFFESCGKGGVISRLLNQLKYRLDCEAHDNNDTLEK